MASCSAVEALVKRIMMEKADPGLGTCARATKEGSDQSAKSGFHSECEGAAPARLLSTVAAAQRRRCTGAS